MRRLLILLVVAGGLVGAYVAYPYWTVQRMSEAMTKGDTDIIEAHIAWERLRAGLKTQFREAAFEPTADSRRLAGSLLTGRVLDQMVDAAVTPAQLRQMFNQPSGYAIGRMEFTDRRFETPWTFRFDFQPSDEPHRAFSARLELIGVVWRVTDLRLPRVMLRGLKTRLEVD